MTEKQIAYQEKLKNLKKVSGIYKLVISDGFYIGSAVNLAKRLREHLNDLIRNDHYNRYLQRAFNKYQTIDFEILDLILLPDVLIQREQYYIDTLKPKYNLAPKAGSQFGFRHSDETKKRISEIGKGRVMSEETRLNQSKAKKGVLLSESHKKNISLSKMGDKNPFYKAGDKHPQYGTKRSESTIFKLSGINNRVAKSGVLYDVETGCNYVFRSLRSMCKKLDIIYPSMKKAARQERFYKDKWYASYVSIPGTAETRVMN